MHPQKIKSTQKHIKREQKKVCYMMFLKRGESSTQKHKKLYKKGPVNDVPIERYMY